jgi:hypothetical protein
MHLFACITCVNCCSLYSWVAQPHTSGSHSKHTSSNAQGDTPSEGGFDALPSTCETPACIDCTKARRRTVQAAAPRGLDEDCMQNALTKCVCGPQPSWSGDLLCFGNGHTDKKQFYADHLSVLQAMSGRSETRAPAQEISQGTVPARCNIGDQKHVNKEAASNQRQLSRNLHCACRVVNRPQ